MKHMRHYRRFTDDIFTVGTRPLWSNCNDSIYSDPFSVDVGYACLLFAVGLERDKVKSEDSEFTSPQTICVHRLIYTVNRTYKRNAVCEEVAVTDTPELVADEIIQNCECCTDNKANCWSLSQQRNIAIIGIPGMYRLELNDATAVGRAQVYAEWYPLDVLPCGIEHLYF